MNRGTHEHAMAGQAQVGKGSQRKSTFAKYHNVYYSFFGVDDRLPVMSRLLLAPEAVRHPLLSFRRISMPSKSLLLTFHLHERYRIKNMSLHPQRFGTFKVS